MSIRFASWLSTGIAAAFLVVATASFSLATTAWLAFAISVGTLVLSTGIANLYRDNRASLITGCLTAAVSVWTIVASLVFSESTVQNLALASALAVGGLAITGLTTHELSVERAVQSLEDDTGERQSRLAAAA
jgi:hypothetical protein